MMQDYDKQREVLHSPFDIDTHAHTFVNYLEVIIHSDGSIHYAVPSHQEYLIRYLQDKLHATRDEIMDMCPPEYYCDFLEWLCKSSGCIAVWNNHTVGHINSKQSNTLRKLKMHGLYKGNITNRRRIYGFN